MSVSISFDRVTKKYGEHVIIPDLSLDVKPGEFFTLLGPSGCGKTTLLRMVIGFNTVEGGEIYFDQKKITGLTPSKRNIGMVFQNYAIFPHLTVRENVAFGLTNRKLSKEEIHRKVEDILQVVQIAPYADRLPEKLSGGQQQRVALARAIVIHPDVLLMDEPLSNLDAKLRVEMRDAIREIQHRVGITTIYVTHDQEEALAVSDRIAVMKDGVLQHVGTPKNIYQRPANLFVATFIGRSNILAANCQLAANRQGEEGGHRLTFSDGYQLEMQNIRPDALPGGSTPVRVAVRPEELVITQRPTGLSGTVNDSIFLGIHTHYQVMLTSGEQVEVVVESGMDETIPPGSTVHLELKQQKINVFDSTNECSLMEGVVNDADLR